MTSRRSTSSRRLPTRFYLAAYPVLAAGLLALIWGRRQRGDISGLLDSAIVTAGLGMLSWVLLARPTIADAGESFAAAAVSVAYPVGDILLLAMLVRFLTTPGAWTASLRLLLTAVGLLVAADTAASALSLLTYRQHRHDRLPVAGVVRDLGRVGAASVDVRALETSPSAGSAVLPCSPGRTDPRRAWWRRAPWRCSSCWACPSTSGRS